ncbi:MAG TPA: response regulator transcription factor [Acidimicrobiia bacterium]|nr:response regulator transcription factor [Acidimicrobiia bacterium]
MAAVASWPTRAPAEARVLVALDDEHLARVIEHVADEHGIALARVDGEREILAAVLGGGVDLVVIGLATPATDTFGVLEGVRARSGVPVVVVSHRNTDGDRVLAYELGADDFIAVPCSTRELSARIATVLRRSSVSAPGRLEFGPLIVDRASRRVTLDGRPVDVTRREFDLLACLGARPRRTLTREELLRDAWGSSGAWQSAATVTEHVRRLRTKLAESTGGGPRITTVRGVGYRFDP